MFRGSIVAVRPGALFDDELGNVHTMVGYGMTGQGVEEFFDGEKRAEDNRFEIGGFGRLKTWLDRAQVGFEP